MGPTREQELRAISIAQILKDRYGDEMTRGQIANEMLTDKVTISRRLHRYNLPEVLRNNTFYYRVTDVAAMIVAAEHRDGHYTVKF